MCEEKDLGHFRMVFNLFRWEQVQTLSLRRVTGFLRQRLRWLAVSWAWVGSLFLQGLSQEELPLLSCGGGSCEEWDPPQRRHTTPFPWCSAVPSPVQLGPSWRHSIAFPGPQVNVLALSICTREAYQSMKERNVDDGHIININR